MHRPIHRFPAATCFTLLWAPAMVHAQAADRWWGEVEVGSGQLHLASTPAVPAVDDSGVGYGVSAGYAINPNVRVGLSYHRLITAVGWYFSSIDQNLDRLHVLVRYCPRAGCGGWVMQAGAGIGRYQDANNFAWIGVPEVAAMDRNGQGASFELGAGYRFHGRHGREAGPIALVASYGAGSIAPEPAGAHSYHYDLLRLAVTFNFP